MVEVIAEMLTRMEINNDINILYACESGSRAWGFASPDSDYDVRFIYARKLSHYLSISEKRDVIEMPVNEILDISGWDIRMALRLFLTSNAPLYEWLQSPIVYTTNESFSADLISMMPEYFSLKAGCHHYLSMAKNTYEKDLQSDKVKIKKYFYALRPALAALWIAENNTVPPMQFGKLRDIINDKNWQITVDDLLEKKKAADEKSMISPIPYLQEWIEKTLLIIQEQSVALTGVKHNTALLDKLFRKYIQS